MKTDDLKSRMKIGKAGIFIFPALCALMGFFYYRMVVVALFHSPGWPAMRGKVIKSYVKKASSTGAAYVNVIPEVVYVYTVDGVKYEGN